MLPNPNTSATTAASMPQAKLVIMRRKPNQGFGFTLRHFIAYPPEGDSHWPQEASEPQMKAMETIFIKEVHANGPAYYANLQTGDRVLMVNNTPIAGIAYSTIVSMIKKTPSELKLLVVPKECDVLQMHYTSIAHTTQSNVTISTSCSATNTAGALVPITAWKPFPHKQLISYSAPSELGNVSTSNVLRTPLSSADFINLTTTCGYPTSTQVLLHASNEGRNYLRSPPTSNLTVLTHQQNVAAATLYTSNALMDNNNLMVRLHESIKQKEEFLKSPVPHAHPQQQQQQQYPMHHHTQTQHFFSHTPPSTNAQLSMASMTTAATPSLGSGLSTTHATHGTPVRVLVKPPVSSSCDKSYASASITNSSHAIGTAGNLSQTLQRPGIHSNGNNANKVLHSSSSRCSSTASGVVLREKHQKDYEFMETLQETGVTNKVFERKLVSHLARGFDPFKPLSINTNAVDNVASPTDDAILMKKPSVLYESLQHHPLHQMQMQQHQSTVKQQHNQVPVPRMIASSAMTITTPTTASNSSSSVVDGQRCSRMELHKASLASTTIDHPANINIISSGGRSNIIKFTSKLAEIEEKSTTLTDIAESDYTSTTTNNNNTTASTAQIDNIKASAASSEKINNKCMSSSSGSVSISNGNNIRETDLNNISSCSSTSNSSAIVVRRFKPLAAVDEGKPMRRISYLRATNNENDYPCDSSSITLTNTYSTIASSRTKTDVSTTSSSISRSNSSGSSNRYSRAQIEEHIDPIYDIVANNVPSCDRQAYLFALDDAKVKSACNSRRNSYVSDMRCSTAQLESSNGLELNGKTETNGHLTAEMEFFETEMEIKSSCINGKVSVGKSLLIFGQDKSPLYLMQRLAEYRSWRQVKIEIKGDILKIYPHRNTKSDSNIIELDIRNFKIFDESLDKKKYIFRMQSKLSPLATLGNELNIDEPQDKSSTPSGNISSTIPHSMEHCSSTSQPHTDILFKTKSASEMKRIFGLLQWKNSLIYDDHDFQGRQTAEPQQTAATATMPTATICDDSVQQQHLILEPSPISSTSRSEQEAAPDSMSPVLKPRKSSHKNTPDKDLGSPKTKNWKDLLFRRGGGGGGGGSSSGNSADLSPSNLSSSTRTFGSIGVPLKICPMSKANEFVPNLVEVCTNIVETKGLGVVGIYRIPGNKAAISELSDQVNKQDFSWDRCLTDVRWEDVNVVSSLLKLFIRSLPDALLPSSFYNHFIEADKKQGHERLTELKHLLESLPRYSYETMKHLFRHLNRVSKNCDVNLMEPKNLAIIFGPSIVRTPNDTLDIAVKDMKHQCRIVELLLTQYDYFFENGDLPNIESISGNNSVATSSNTLQGIAATQQHENQTNMLLHNISKIERLTERDNSSSTRTSRFIPQLRKRGQNKRGSDTYSGDSVLSLDYMKSSCATTTSSSSSSSTTAASSKNVKKKERSFLSHGIRTHHRKASLDEKDSGSGSTMAKEQRSSVDISILLTDDESGHSRISDTGSMSLGVVTDTLDSKLSKLRNGSELNQDNASLDFPKNRRHTLGQPFHLHSENIPYADESPERLFQFCPLDNINKPSKNLMSSKSCTATNTLLASIQSDSEREKEKSNTTTTIKTNMIEPTTNTYQSSGMHKLQHSATAPINVSLSSAGCLAAVPTATLTPAATTSDLVNLKGVNIPNPSAARPSSYTINKNFRFSPSVYDQCGSDDDSEGSTTSDPKEALILAAPTAFLSEKFNKKRRDHRLFRSASFNCRNYSTRGGGGSGSLGGTCTPCTVLTKDEKTDMNLTKKRQIQNKQNRSIKRRHTVGGPHDYGAGDCVIANNCNRHCKGKSFNAPGPIITTMVLKRKPLTSANANITNNNNNINNNNNNNNTLHHEHNGHTSSSSSNGNHSSSSGGGSSNTATVNMAGEHVLEVGIRIKNINRNRFQS